MASNSINSTRAETRGAPQATEYQRRATGGLCRSAEANQPDQSTHGLSQSGMYDPAIWRLIIGGVSLWEVSMDWF